MTRERYWMNGGIILFGAGKMGLEALEKFRGRVAFFCDNSSEKVGTFIEGIEVISFEKMKQLHKKGYRIIVTPHKSLELCRQLKAEGICDYVIYYSSMEKRQKTNYEEVVRSSELVDQYLKIISGQDLLQDFLTFKEITKKLLKEHDGKKYLQNKFGESNYYGSLSGIVEYAGLENENINVFPTVSHYNTYMPAMGTDIRKGVIIAGERYKKFVHRHYSYIPVYTVGPYIHYVKGIYDAETVKKYKEKQGKTLTLFIPHTTECNDMQYNGRCFIDRVLSLYGEEFDTIQACIYWSDVNRPICDYMEKLGIRMMSAGYRFDPMFNKRLKTIFELTDAVVCADVGSYIGYAIYFDIPVGFIDISVERIDFFKEGQFYWLTGDEELAFHGYQKVFSERLEITEEQRAFVNEVSGLDKIREPQYFRDVLAISKDILAFCGYEESKYPIGVYSAYDYYRKTDQIEKALILREAVGDNFL